MEISENIIYELDKRCLRRLLLFVAINLLLVVLNYGEAQITFYQDCSELRAGSVPQGVVTNKEKIRSLDIDYSIELSRFRGCEEPDSDSSSGTALDGTNQQLSEDSQSDNQRQSIVSSKITKSKRTAPSKELQSLSLNLKVSGEKSIAIRRDGQQMVDPAVGKPQKKVIAGGKNHDRLAAVDNMAILKAQIQAQVDSEEDPEVKRNLMERLEKMR